MSTILKKTDKIPSDAILVLTNAKNVRTAYFTGEKLPTDRTKAEELADYKKSAITRIDEMVDDARAKYVTGGIVQSLVYNEKRLESEAYKTAGYPANDAPYPSLSFEAAATGVTSKVLADTILTNATLWKTLSGKIEAAKVTSKLASNSQTTIKGVDSALATAALTFESL